MPLPPFDTEVIEENPSFQFTQAECLLFALHTLGKQVPEFFAFTDEPLKLKEFRSRLQYLARGTQGLAAHIFNAIQRLIYLFLFQCAYLGTLRNCKSH